MLEVDIGERLCDEPRLVGHVRTGDGAEDEWFVVHLLRQLSRACADLSCRVFDSDGELLLIEAALATPRWLTPVNAEHRCWIRGGQVHLLPRPRPPEPEQLPLPEALKRLRSVQGSTVAKDAVQQAIAARLEGYPKRAIELSTHVARAVLPVPLARAVAAYPQLVSVAIDHLPPPPTKELLRLRRQLEGDEADVHFDCEGPSAQETACIGVRLTRCQYAWLMGMRCQLPQRFTQKHWLPPPAFGGNADDKAMQLGAKLCAGLEAAFLQGTKSATAALRWPDAKADQAVLLPRVLPWTPDEAFARHISMLQPTVNTGSAASRRAFLQQSELDEPFRRAFSRALGSANQAVDLTDCWRDVDDAEDWLHVSAEELDKEMMARQAEFDAYDRASASRGAEESKRPAGMEGPEAEKLQQDVAALGKQLSGLLTQASCLDGVEVAGRGAAESKGAAAAAAGAAAAAPGNARGGDRGDSDDSGSEELDVLGLEEEEESSEDAEESHGRDHGGSIHEYMSELDEQLESELDSKIPAADVGGQGLNDGSLPLGSHHIKVHHTGPIELDMHAMEHVLASYCSEHQLSPGPASLLLGELGLASRAGAGPGRAPTDGAVSREQCVLSAMD